MSKEMKVVLVTLLVVAGVLPFLPSGYVSAGGVVVNPGFEIGIDGTPLGWNLTGNATRVNTGPIYEGDWAAQITGTGDTLTQWVGNITELRTYEFWGWVYVSGNVTGIIAVDFWAGAAGKQLSSTTMLSVTDTDDAYVQKTGLVYTPPETTHLRIRLVGSGWHDGEEVRFDGIGFWPPQGVSSWEDLLGEFCFIATAAYGSPMADEIQVLRDFRDQYLLPNPAGTAFVKLYYSVSPPMAEFITGHPSLKPVVRAGLAPALAISSIAVNASTAEKIAVLGILLLTVVAVAVWATKRRGRGPRCTQERSAG